MKKPRPSSPTSAPRTPLLDLCEHLGNTGTDALCAFLDMRNLRNWTQVNRAFSRSAPRKVLFRRAQVRFSGASMPLVRRMLSEMRQVVHSVSLPSTAELPTAATHFANCARLVVQCMGTQSLLPLRSMTKLRTLQLRLQDSASRVDLAPLAHLVDLEELNLKVAAGDDFSFVHRMPKLKSLALSTKSTLADLAFLRHCERLTKLDLGAVKIADFAHVGLLRQLESLVLHSTGLADVAVVTPLSNLRTLSIANNVVNDLLPLAALPQLTNLDISANELLSVDVLRVLVNLVRLSIICCFGAFDRALDWTPLAELKQLKVLAVRNIGVLSASFLLPLPQLTVLKISPLEADDTFACVRRLTQLETLAIDLKDWEDEDEDEDDGDGDDSVDAVEFPDLSTLTRLKTLKVQTTQHWIYDMTNLLRLPPTLVRLDLSEAILDDLTPLAEQVQLKVLQLGHCQPLPGSVELDLAPLATLRRLTTLTLEFYDIQGLEVLTGFANLVFLNLAFTNVRDVSALRTMTALEILFLGATQVTDVAPLFGLQSLRVVMLPVQAPCAQLKMRLPVLEELHHPETNCFSLVEGPACPHG